MGTFFPIFMLTNYSYFLFFNVSTLYLCVYLFYYQCTIIVVNFFCCFFYFDLIFLFYWNDGLCLYAFLYLIFLKQTFHAFLQEMHCLAISYSFDYALSFFSIFFLFNFQQIDVCGFCVQ